MGDRTKIAIGVGAAILLAAGLIIYLHQPPKPVRVRQSPRVTEFVGVGFQLRMDRQTHAVIIQQVVPNTPAAAAGLTSGLMNLAVVGNIVTSWSWFGVNMLGIGLHSYGFTDAAFRWLMLFVGSQVCLIILGLLPTKFWRSFQSQSKPGLDTRVTRPSSA